MTDPITLSAFLNKGGPGKTTTVAHLAVAFDDLGFDVLAIDLAGKQGDLGKLFGVWDDWAAEFDREDGDDWPNVATVFDDNWPVIEQKLYDGEPAAAVAGLAVATGEGPDLIPAHPALDSLDDELGNIDDAGERYSRFAAFADDAVQAAGYDVLLIDLPGYTNNVSLNGLWAAPNVVTPVEAGPLEARGVGGLRDDLERIREGFGVDVELACVLPNKIDRRTTLADEFLDKYGADYGDVLAPAVVPQSQAIRNAAAANETLFASAMSSATAKQARETFRTTAEWLAERLGGGA